ncbi:SDR family oxidoreductase [Sorangium sp. So ce363]|uniref:SDR family oxidoreductase n=1 Tax=Sorangium sp. So ce363 TaxID=3133304 RepID=UPI003F5E3F01
MTKTILITGSSSGLGRATAKHFSAKGWNVVATMRNPEREEELIRLDRVLVTRLDVQDLASIHAAVDAGISRFGRIDALMNNAGYGAYGPLEATSLDKVRRQFDVNVLGVLATTKALLPHFRANRSGVIVNISSGGGRVTLPLGTLYHGTKFAVEGLSESLHFELAPLGVRVKIVEPGAIKTDFMSRSLDFSNDPQLSEYQPLVQKVLAVIGPMMEQGAPPERVAESVYAATTDDSNQLRYEVGVDVVELLGSRRSMDDATFLGGMRTQFGLEG